MKNEGIIVECFEEKWIYDYRCLFFGVVRDELSLRLRAVDDYDEEILPAGHHYIRCALDEVLLFIRPGHIIPVAQPANNTSELDDASLTLWSFLPDGESAEYRMYRDDGVTTEYEKKEHWKTLQIHHS